MICELCGKQAELVNAIIEGTEMSVCSECSKFGRVIKKPVSVKKFVPKRPEKEIIQVIVPDYAKVIKYSRERKNLTQKDFARLISEKESVVHNLEIGKHEPSINLARKLEKILGINLVEEHEEATGKRDISKSEGFTIGDFVKFKK